MRPFRLNPQEMSYRSMPISDSPNEVPVSTISSEFLFTANRPDHSAAVAARLAQIPDCQTLKFDSAVIYQNSEGGGLSRIVVKYVSPGRIILVESRPSVNGPIAEVRSDDGSSSR
jgi:hypothetical protein